MAITASTSGYDSIVKCGPGKTLFEEALPFVSSSITWYQGDMLCYDTSAHTLRVVAATSDAATIVGVADNTVISGQLNSPYAGLTAVNAAQTSPGIAGPKYGVVATPVLKTSDAFAPGVKVYLVNGGNTQTVSSTDPGDGNYIGIYVGANVASATAGQKGQVLVGARYPSATGTGLVF